MRLVIDTYYFSQVMDVVFVLDSSANVGSSGWNSMLDAVNQMVSGLDVSSAATRVGVVTFGQNAVTNIPLNANPDKVSLMGAIRNLPFLNDNAANFYDALLAAQSAVSSGVGNRPDVPDVVVFITGSSSSVNQALVPVAARQLRNNGTLVYAVGVGNRINQTEIQAISAHPHLQYHQWWTAADFTTGLQSIVNGVVGEICKPPLGI